MSLESKKIIKQLGDKLLTQTLVCQTIIDMLIDKGICTSEEFDENLTDNIMDLEDMVIKNGDLLDDVNSFLENDFGNLDDESEWDDDLVTGGMFYGIIGEA